MRRAVLSIALSSILLALGACQREAEPVVASAPASSASAMAVPPASASRPGHGAPDDGKQALMREAFPDRDGQRAPLMSVADPDPKSHETLTVAVAPEQVVAIDATHRVLVVSGAISDEQGHLGGGHAVPGNLGAYWFELRDGRWFVTRRSDSVLWAGFMGNLGTVKPLALGGAHPAVTILSGSCWQGFCAGYLDVVEFEADRARQVVSGLRVSTDSTGGRVGCEEALAGQEPDPDAPPDDLGPDNCFDIDGQWRIAPGADGQRGDLVVTFSGTELVADDDNGGHVAKKVAQSLVLRYADGTYKPVSGKNPTHDF